MGSSALRAHNFRQFRQISNLHKPPKKNELMSFKNITKIGSIRVTKLFFFLFRSVVKIVSGSNDASQTKMAEMVYDGF